MRILVLSDNHRRNIDFNLNEYNYIFHLGERGEFESSDAIMVRGNCDFDGEKTIITTIEGKKILLTHGDLYGVKEGLTRISLLALERGVDYVFYGHTHCPSFFEYRGIKFINPGAYLDGRYVIINNEKIVFYNENKVERTIVNKW